MTRTDQSIMLSLLSLSSSGFTPAMHIPASAPRCAGPVMGVESMEGVGPETGNKIFDPLGLADGASERTLAWYRAAELKHGRVAMAGCAGVAWVTAGGNLFAPPETLMSLDGTTFGSLGREPFAAWEALPAVGKLQIILVIGAIEALSEAEKPHYMAGGVPGKIKVFGLPLFDPFNFLAKSSADVRKTKRVSELKNGRLAMIGIMSVIANHYVPGSVPIFSAGLVSGNY